MSGKATQHHLVKVFNGNLWQAQLVQGLLESNHIKCMIENDTMSAVTSPYATLGGEVWVLVNDCDEDEANGIIKDSCLASNPFN